MIPIKKIATHANPHFDDILGCIFLQRFGEDVFPGVSGAEIVFWPNGGTPDGRLAEYWERDGFLMVGVGGGRFDEHPSGGASRKENECAATLVAKALGLDQDPRFRQLLQFALKVDSGGAAHPFDVSSVINWMNRLHRDNPAPVFAWVREFLDAYLNHQEDFRVALRACKEDGKVCEIPRGERRIRMLAIESDLNEVMAAARLEQPYGPDADIVVQRRSSGNVQILTSKKACLDLAHVAAAIRRAERRAKGLPEVMSGEGVKLFAEGKVPGAEEWFFFLAGMMLLNGSLSAPETPPTKLTLDQIVDIVRANVRLKPPKHKAAWRK